MTVAGIIEQYNTERPNNVEDSLKCSWLKKVEEIIVDVIIKRHQGAPDDEILDEHIAKFGMDSDLLVDEPYDDLYIYFLDQRVSLNNNDTKRYNVAASMYNNAMLTYQQKYNREHKALKGMSQLIRHEEI